jgi:hypothetical protein
VDEKDWILCEEIPVAGEIEELVSTETESELA